MATKPAPRRKTVIRPATRALILKATGDDDPVACYDQHGNLMGICAPKDIQLIADPSESAAAPAAKKKSTQTQRTETAAGEDPQMGVAKARAAAGQLKRQLYTSVTTEEQNQLATAMNVAAADVLKQIHARPRRRRS